MIHIAIESPCGLPDTSALVFAAIRSWRMARDEGASVQNRLYAMLSRHNCGILAPVFDSFAALCEVALGRSITVGTTAPSDDEALLIGLLNGSRHRRASMTCSDSAGSMLDRAICSTRIMMALAVEPPIAARAA